MKKLLLLVCLLGISLGASAEDYTISKGYRGNVEAGFVVGTGKYGMSQFMVQTTHGYQLLPDYLYVGGGVGIGTFTGDNTLRYGTNIFADVRSYYPLKSRFKPYVDLKAGFAWVKNDEDNPAIKDSYQDGFFCTPTVGCNFKINKLLGVDLAVGYHAQISPWTPIPNPTGQKQEFRNIGGVIFRAGFSF